jgi:hypothetical protein
MCIWYETDFPGGAYDIANQNKFFPQKWMGYCAEQCDKIAGCEEMTIGMQQFCNLNYILCYFLGMSVISI